MKNSDVINFNKPLPYIDNILGQDQSILNISPTKVTDTDFHFNLIANPAKTNSSKGSTPKSVHSPPIKSPLKFKERFEQSDIKSPFNMKGKNQSDIKSPNHLKNAPDLPITPKNNYILSPNSSSKNNNKNNNDNDISKFMTSDNSPNNIYPKSPATPGGKSRAEEEVRVKKLDLLKRLIALSLKGCILTKKYDMNSSLNDIELEYELQKHFIEKKNAIAMGRNLLLTGSNFIEYFNQQVNPVGLNLNGWHQHIGGEIDSWNDIIEEMAEKYKGDGKGSIPVEARFAAGLISSAVFFHIANKATSDFTFNNLANKNPDLIERILREKKEKNKKTVDKSAAKKKSKSKTNNTSDISSSTESD